MKMVVAQMYNCIRMEFRKCFHSHNFIIQWQPAFFSH